MASVPLRPVARLGELDPTIAGVAEQPRHPRFIRVRPERGHLLGGREALDQLPAVAHGIHALGEVLAEAPPRVLLRLAGDALREEIEVEDPVEALVEEPVLRLEDLLLVVVAGDVIRVPALSIVVEVDLEEGPLVEREAEALGDLPPLELDVAVLDVEAEPAALLLRQERVDLGPEVQAGRRAADEAVFGRVAGLELERDPAAGDGLQGVRERLGEGPPAPAVVAEEQAVAPVVAEPNDAVPGAEGTADLLHDRDEGVVHLEAALERVERLLPVAGVGIRQAAVAVLRAEGLRDDGADPDPVGLRELAEGLDVVGELAGEVAGDVLHPLDVGEEVEHLFQLEGVGVVAAAEAVVAPVHERPGSDGEAGLGSFLGRGHGAAPEGGEGIVTLRRATRRGAPDGAGNSRAGRGRGGRAGPAIPGSGRRAPDRARHGSTRRAGRRRRRPPRSTCPRPGPSPERRTP